MAIPSHPPIGFGSSPAAVGEVPARRGRTAATAPPARPGARPNPEGRVAAAATAALGAAAGAAGPNGSEGAPGPRPQIVTLPTRELFGPNIAPELAALLERAAERPRRP